MNILIAIGIALIGLFVLVALVKLAFNLLVMAVVVAVGVVAYLAIERLVGKGR